MKKLVLAIAVAGMLYAVPAFAHCPDGYKSTLNSYGHSHCYIDTDTDTDTIYKREAEAGIGTDIVLWENSKKSLIEDVTTQYRYDFNNGGEHKVYGVVRLNLWEKIRGFLHR